jgi:Raf kinase inhibitor-like YbhB/YbcL family protein
MSCGPSTLDFEQPPTAAIMGPEQNQESRACLRPAFLPPSRHLHPFDRFGCVLGQQERSMTEQTPIPLTSPVFEHEQPIPRDYTADGQNLSPPLRWGELPTGTQSLALICEDPDAPRGTFAHWVAYNLSPKLRALDHSLTEQTLLPDGSDQGMNDFNRSGYSGPSPPPGKPHRYFFRLFALDTKLNLPPGATREQVLVQIPGHVLGHGELMGTYGRNRS